MRSDNQVLEFLDRDPAQSMNEALQWIQTIRQGVTNNEYIAWAISLKGDKTLIGTISFWNVKKEHYRSEIGYALHPGNQGKGLMQEAMVTVLDYGFKTMKLHSVEANVNPNYVASIKLLERNNFVREAYHKENYEIFLSGLVNCVFLRTPATRRGYRGDGLRNGICGAAASQLHVPGT